MELEMAVTKEKTGPPSSEAPMSKSSRPPGITNEEFHVSMDRLRAAFGAFYQDIRNRHGEDCGSLVSLGLEPELLRLFRETFVIPDGDRAFVDEDYVRTVYGLGGPAREDINRQKLACAICHENRSVDRAHIIPSQFGAGLTPGNSFLLCPTHHRLFDHGKLHRSEWGGLNWSGKDEASVDFGMSVLLLRQDAFWRGAPVSADIGIHFSEPGNPLSSWLAKWGLRR